VLVPVSQPSGGVLLFLLVLVKNSTRVRACVVSEWLDGHVRSFHGSQNIVDDSDSFEFVVADFNAGPRWFSRFETKNQVAALGQVQHFAKPSQTRTWHTPVGRRHNRNRLFKR